MPSDAAKRGPIFIGGPDRCGKTTLRAFLVSHPNISIPAVGSNMWTYFYGRYGDLGNPLNFERCLNAMMHYKHVRFLKPDPERIRREFVQGQPIYARLFALFQQHHAEGEGKPRWGDQTGLVERYADEIFAAYPGAKMIHMVRDPRDRYEASITLWPKGKGRVGGATARWLYSVNLGKRNQRQYPCCYKFVRFESLITDTGRTLRDICHFLGEDFAPEMLTMDGAEKFRDGLRKSTNGKDGRVLSVDYIGLFRKKMTQREILFMQTWARRDMLQFGYEMEPIQMSAFDWLTHSLWDFPANLLRKSTWRAVEEAQQRFPRFIHRSIDPKKRIKPGKVPVPRSV